MAPGICPVETPRSFIKMDPGRTGPGELEWGRGRPTTAQTSLPTGVQKQLQMAVLRGQSQYE